MGSLDGNTLLTGGSGTLGRAMLLFAEKEKREASFTVFSRSESRLSKLKQSFPRARTIIGDVRDTKAVHAAVPGHDLVIHMAALKRIPECEEQPRECILTNIIGTMNVLDACVAHQVPCVIVSTDKACQAATTYGASKLLTESLLLAASRECTDVKFTGVRYGNIIASEGSLLSIWQRQAKMRDPLTITSRRMTRFWMSPFDAVELIEDSLDAPSGSIVVPKMSALSIEEMAAMLYPRSSVAVLGLRSNEKLHEDLIHPYEPVREQVRRFIIQVGSDLRTGYTYSSEHAPRLERDDLLRMISDAEEVERCS